MSDERNKGDLDDKDLDSVSGGIREGGCVIIDYPWPLPEQEPPFGEDPIVRIPVGELPYPELDPCPLSYYEEY